MSLHDKSQNEFITDALQQGEIFHIEVSRKIF